MARYPVSFVKALFARVGKELGWTTTGPRWTRVGDRNVCTIGHVSLERNSVYGWNINQTMNESGGERQIMSSRSTAELVSWLEGAEYAIERKAKPI